MTAPHDPEASLSLAKRIAFTAVLLLLMGAVLEVGASLYLRAYRGYAGGEFLQYQFDPYKNIALTRNWTDTRGVHHDAQGFRRSTDVARVKPAGTYRIFLMGASTAYGLGTMWPGIEKNYAVLDNTQTIDAYLERILAGRLPYAKVEVINAGIPSQWTHHELIYLNQSILSYDPDMILFLDGYNDYFQFDLSTDQFASYSQTKKADDIMGPPTLSSLVTMNLWWLFRRSSLAQLTARVGRDLRLIIRGTPYQPPIDVPTAIRNLQVVFDRGPRKMIERNALILRHEGIPAIFLLQPMLALERDHLNRMSEHERSLFELNISSYLPNYEQFIRQARPLISKRVEETVVPLGASYLDLTDIYPTSEGQIFTDYAHLTPEGNRILAEHVADEIVRRATAPQGSPTGRPR